VPEQVAARPRGCVLGRGGVLWLKHSVVDWKVCAVSRPSGRAGPRDESRHIRYGRSISSLIDGF
jgi:hypothetical protein